MPDFEIIGASFDLGALKPGSAGAPRLLRERGLTSLVESMQRRGLSISDAGDVEAPPAEDGESEPKNLPQLVSFSGDLMAALDRSYGAGRLPIVLGGDHSISMPSVSAASRHLRESRGPDAELGLIWVDAHPDLEMPGESPTSKLHAMTVAHLLGQGIDKLADLGGFRPKLDPGNVVFIGLQDVTSRERATLEKLDMVAYTASDVERLGISEICERTFDHMASRTTAFVLSFDIDACDPMIAPGVLYPEPGGLTFREARLIMEFAHASPNLMSLELVEVDPVRDIDSRTAEAAVLLLRAAMLGPVI